jgi:FKBP-type peptidyl-prolyl cis-trans isomerase
MSKADQQFLVDNATKEGVVTTASGLQYKVLEPSDGPKPESGNVEVEVHYEGKLIDGKVFDSSYKRGESISFGPAHEQRGEHQTRHRPVQADRGARVM